MSTNLPGAASGTVRVSLRIEAFAILAATVTAFFVGGASPWLFVALFFVPDLSFAAYLLGPKAGAAVYNTMHGYILPVFLAALGFVTGTDWLWQIALVFAAHTAFDRSLGYGLKYASDFTHTHLGVVGKRGKAA